MESRAGMKPSRVAKLGVVMGDISYIEMFLGLQYLHPGWKKKLRSVDWRKLFSISVKQFSGFRNFKNGTGMI